MASRRSFAEFDSSVEDWISYSERFDFFLESNDIREIPLQLATFLSSVGPSTYKLVRNLCVPRLPKEMTYKEVKELLENHFRPKPSIAVERLKFHSTVRSPSESVSSYIARLRSLSEFCQFANLDEMLRDRLVCGINNPRIQKLLLTESSERLTFKRAQELAESAEAADRSICDVTSTSMSSTSNITTQQVNAMSEGRKQPRSRTRSNPEPVSGISRQRQNCYRCGGTRHQHPHCPFKDATCHFCHKKGHIIRVCRKRQGMETKKKSNAQQTNTIAEDRSDVREPEPRCSEQLSSISGASDPYPNTLYAVRSQDTSPPSTLLGPDVIGWENHLHAGRHRCRCHLHKSNNLLILMGDTARASEEQFVLDDLYG